MSSVLYYSKYCKYCTDLIQDLSKTEYTKDIHFVCIDNREKGPDNKTYTILENGQKIIMPEITRVPAVLLLNQGFKIIYLEEIKKRFKSKQQVVVKQATQNNLEPMAFSFGGGGSAIVSDNYSFLDMNDNELLAKGDGGVRQMHNYVDVNASFSIPTPTDDVNYKGSNKIPQDVTIEKLMQQREMEISMPPQQQYQKRT
jgi:subtilase family serine protease